MINSKYTKSIVGYIAIHRGGPVSWGVKREQKNSRSSCKAEIKSTDAITKVFLCHRNICGDLALTNGNRPAPCYSNNKGAVDWAHSRITKKLCYLNTRENAVRDLVGADITFYHIEGGDNPADIWTKEKWDNLHFLGLQDTLVVPHEHGGC